MGDLGGASYPADEPVLEDERNWAMAAVRANEGKIWEYPVTTRWVS